MDILRCVIDILSNPYIQISYVFANIVVYLQLHNQANIALKRFICKNYEMGEIRDAHLIELGES